MAMLLIPLAIALAAPPDAISEQLALADHLASSVPLEVYYLADGNVEVTAQCSGCLLDVEFYEWTGADDAAAKGALAAELAISNSAIDVVRARLALPEDRTFGVDVLVYWLDALGAVQTTKVTFFGRIEKATFWSRTWTEFAIDSGFARLTTLGDNTPALDIGQTITVVAEEVRP